ncbi:hypothetical protein PQE68_gp061 [Bacillus phage vB_BanS_Sophrita]|uniref:Uncharacterized protein n=1 Tax=Bacillus phage vB_BanS_Sophrita TaxID=2894790 RepID=A0AAE8YXK1_9CAUD|nr:hypothetical protein PQE68_gp061 [Bacillus phage vB_BanS_Sophrita]UGO50652.1 hypothetical protein SOPHRITA_61 [Bacillus phage vB_BanS_Sophrita]
MGERIVDRLIDKYEDYGDWSKVSVLEEIRPAISMGDYDMIDELHSVYTRYGDWSKTSALEELKEELGE